MFAHLRTTERHLKILSLPFGFKKVSRKSSISTKSSLSTKSFDRQGLKPFYKDPIRTIKLRSISTKVEKPVRTNTELLNPAKAAAQNLTISDMAKIKPVTLARFPKTVNHLPSVTKILQATMPAASQFILERWKEGMIKKLGAEGFQKYQQDTFERGRLLHALIASHLLGQTDPVDISKEVVVNLWKSIEGVVNEHISNVRLVEHVVTHTAMGYRGIVDCVACYKDELVVIDFKTSEKPKKTLASLYDNPLQVTAYCGAINNDKTIPKSVIDRNICAGLVIVAYMDGSEASVYYLGRDKVINDLWKQWTTRLEQFSQMEDSKNLNRVPSATGKLPNKTS